MKDAVINKDTLVILEPPRGIWNVPIKPMEQSVKIVLLPQGDHRLLSKEGLKLLVNDIIKRETEKKTEILKLQLGKLEQQLTSLTEKDPLADEALRLGFSKEELLDALGRFKQQLQQSNNPYEVGLAALYDKFFAKAITLITKSIEEDERLIKEKTEDLPDKYINLGNAYIGEYNLIASTAAYKKSIELEPTGFLGYFRLAMVLYIAGDLQGVLKNYKKSLVIIRKENFDQISQNEGAALGNLGLVFSNLGEPDSALIYLNKCKKILHEIENPYEKWATDWIEKINKEKN